MSVSLLTASLAALLFSGDYVAWGIVSFTVFSSLLAMAVVMYKRTTKEDEVRDQEIKAYLGHDSDHNPIHSFSRLERETF